MKVKRSQYLADNKALFEKLQKILSKKYDYASVLAADGKSKIYSVSARGTNVSADDMFGRRGFTARVYNGKAYAEYSASEISEESIPQIIEKIDTDLAEMASGFERVETPLLKEKRLKFVKSSEYKIHPEELGDEKIVEKLTSLREYTLGLDERLLDCLVNISYQQYSKLFISDKRKLEQSALWTCGYFMAVASKGEELKSEYKSFSTLGGIELMDAMKTEAPTLVKNVIDLLDSEPMIPGEYECICTPEVTGMIVHEAFGHGVEMDMFVKDRALAKSFIGENVASEIVSMRDGAASAKEVASFFFDDEGNEAKDTLVIDHGKLVSGYADAVSAARLGVAPTGNGRRESVERKTYTRMTNTFFEGGKDSVDDMIKSVKYGMLLCSPSSGMEDPKNWGIQCMVSYAREIKDGQLTGKVFAPVVLTGYVPDLLKSISMMSPTVELGGGGACGKGHKEWVKVSDGGPWIKAQIRLG